MAYLDEGLANFREQWKAKYPKATVYWVADDAHSQNPDVSQHAPDRGGSKPGDDKGEVDAVDVMPGNGVTDAALTELFEGLHREKDPRVLYVIYKRQIFSSVTRPWVIRSYSGNYHGHVHISVNDNFDKNTTKWDWEKELSEKAHKLVTVKDARLPESLVFGMDDDGYSGMNHVSRAQALLNYLDRKDPLDIDGVYGAYTVKKVKTVFGGTGRVLTLANLRKLHGI